jgi:hypothetical protein
LKDARVHLWGVCFDWASWLPVFCMRRRCQRAPKPLRLSWSERLGWTAGLFAHTSRHRKLIPTLAMSTSFDRLYLICFLEHRTTSVFLTAIRLRSRGHPLTNQAFSHLAHHPVQYLLVSLRTLLCPEFSLQLYADLRPPIVLARNTVNRSSLASAM